jgi:hypothetical protein
VSVSLLQLLLEILYFSLSDFNQNWNVSTNVNRIPHPFSGSAVVSRVQTDEAVQQKLHRDANVPKEEFL